MEKTVKLFYQDAYIEEFEAQVLYCAPADEGYKVILDRTAFYPEGGGQSGDTGILGEARVCNTVEEEDVVVHLTDRPLSCGSLVRGRIDFERRFDFMQQHSGEHIVSGLVFAAYGYHNVGFHMGSDVVTIDFDGMLTEEQLREIEAEANRRIWNNLKLQVLYPSEEELASMEYRSKKELTGQVRIVEIPGTDVCACCGTHVERTGEIGMIKILSVMNFRSGVRVEMISGRRVYDYITAAAGENHKISVLLSAKETETSEAVKHMQEENYRLRGEIGRLLEASFVSEAQRHKGQGNVLIFREGLSSDNVRKLTDAVMTACGGICAVFSENEDGTFKYAIGQKDGDLRHFTKEMNEALKGRGGGKPFFVQGQVKASEKEIRNYLSGTNMFPPA